MRGLEDFGLTMYHKDTLNDAMKILNTKVEIDHYTQATTVTNLNKKVWLLNLLPHEKYARFSLIIS